MNQLIHGIHHVCLNCAGEAAFERTVAFYRDTLGLPVALCWGEGKDAAVMLDTGGGMIEIFANAADTPGQGALRHIALKTRDVDACVQAVRAAGCEVFVAPCDVVIQSNPPLPARIAFCYGPVNEQIEFFCEK